MLRQTKAVFLDRDGTIIAENDGTRVSRPGDVALLPEIPEGLRILKDLGFLLIVVTNQRGEDSAKVKAINEATDDCLILSGAPTIDAYYWCPHEVADACSCRKPKPGLLLMASGDLGIDLSCSYMVGNSLRDLQAGNAAGVRMGLLGPIRRAAKSIRLAEGYRW